MKRKNLLFLLLLALGLPWAAKAQVTIGTGTGTQNMSPVANYFNYSFTEMIYTADEISAGNPSGDYILNVGFQLASEGLNGKTYSISVYMQNVDVDKFEGESAAFTAVSADDLVYEGTMSATAAGWVTLDLQTPFQYDNTKNLLIAINKTAGGYAGNAYNWNYTSTTSYQHLYKQTDSSPGYSISELPTSPTRNYNRPNVQLTFGDRPTCFKTSGITVTNVTTTGASLSWTPNVNGTETAWVLQYGTDASFATGSYTETTVSTNPTTTLSGLTTESVYYARVKPECDTDGTLWSDVASFWPTATVEVVVNNGTTTNSYVPFYGYVSYGTPNQSQFIIPAANLEDINPGSTLKRMTLHSTSSYSNVNWGTASFNVYLKEVTDDNFASATFIEDGLTTVYEGTLILANNQMEIIMNRDFTYNGGNLLVGFELADNTGASNGFVSWYGVNGSGNNSVYTYMGYSSQTGPSLSTFMPKVTFRLIQAEVTCDKPKNLAASDITHEEATITWTSDESAWNIAWSTDPDFDPATATNHADNVGEKTYTITGLNTLTDYYVAVQSACGGDWSNKLHFTTTAFAEPVGDSWADDFEGASCGWELINGTLTNAWAWGTATNNGGSHALYISNDGGTTNAYTNNSAVVVYAAKLLQFADNKYEFTYDWNANGESTYDYLRVALVPASVTLTAGTSTPSGFSTTGLPTGWIALDGGSKLNQVTAWQSKSVAVNVPAGNYYLVMVWRDDTSGGTNPPAAVDNVSITRLACPYDVDGLAVSDITTTGATLTWTSGEAEQWQVAYSTNSSFEGATEEIVSAATYTMTSLTSSTTYYVKVRAYCGGTDFGSWSEMKQFNTACEALDLSTVDFSENFDDITLPSTYTPSTRTLPICWKYINTSTYSSNAVHPTMYYYDYTDYSHSTPNSLRFYCSYSSYSSYDPQDQYAILPEMENMAGKQITLWARGYNATSTFKIGMMTDPTDASTFTMIAEQELTTEYQEFSYILGEGNYVAIMMEAANSITTTKGVYIDDITIADAPSCAKPTNLEAIASGLSVTCTWESEAEAFEIAHATDATANPAENVAGTATEASYTMDDLALGDHYFWVRANCGNNDYSEWAGPASVHIGYCVPAPTSVDNNGISNVTFGFGDNVVNNSTHPVSSPFYGDYTSQIGAVQAGVEATVSITYATAYTYNTYVWVDLDNSLSFEPEEVVAYGESTNSNPTTLTLNFTIPATQNVGDYRMRIGGADSGLGSDPANANPCYNGTYGIFEDYTLRVLEAPDCMVAGDVTVAPENITSTSAVISWTNNNGDEATYTVMQGETVLTTTAVNSYTIEGLTAATTYPAGTFTIISDCDENAIAAVPEFSTLCEAITITAETPYTQDFEAPVVTTTYGQIGEMPMCWENYPVNAVASAKILAANASYNYAESGQVLYFYGDGNNYAVLPEFTNPLNTLQISFKYATESSSNGTLTLGFIKDEDENFNTFEPVSSASIYNASSTSYHKFVNVNTISLNNLPDNATRLVFRWYYSSQWGCNVDDVEVSLRAIPSFTKEIAAVGEENWEGGRGGYYLIASPLDASVSPAEVGMITDEEGSDEITYDLYSFDQAQDLEWQNYRAFNFNIVGGQGYLYASKYGTTLTFTGDPAISDAMSVELFKTDNTNVDFQGWNLVGNPFTEDAYIEKPFYTLENSDTYTANEAGTAIHAMQGLFVIADENGEMLTFTNEAPSQNAKLNMNLRSNDKQLDNAILVFGGNQQLGKMSFRENSSKIYMPVEGKDYAIATAESSMGEMPVSFKAENNGTYTLSFTAEDVTFAYLHLIDNMTGIETDLLETPSYSFEAKTTDYASRFKLVFATGNNGNDDNFAFFSNGNFVINNEGNATLQVVDVMGRILKSESINGCANVNVNAAPGVYMLRLVNGDNVKVQKVVVR